MKQKSGYIEWSTGYSVGDSNVDAQHKRLFDSINQLADLANQKDDNKAKRFSDVSNMLLFLKNYSYLHFRDEEKAMAEIKYLGLEYHKLLHQSFTENVNQTYNEFFINKEIDLDQLLKTLKDWLTNHILQEDMKAFNIG